MWFIYISNIENPLNKNNTEHNLLTTIQKRLEVLIYLQLRRNEIEEMNVGEQFVLLKRLGFDDSEIANLFGKTRGYVSSEITRLKKRKKQ